LRGWGGRVGKWRSDSCNDRSSVDPLAIHDDVPLPERWRVDVNVASEERPRGYGGGILSQVGEPSPCFGLFGRAQIFVVGLRYFPLIRSHCGSRGPHTTPSLTDR
jgi:hypothetical protein